MTFTPGSPFDGESLLNSKPEVRGNFTSLFNTIDENHYPPNDANAGAHRKAVFINDSAAVSTSASEVTLFPQSYDSSLQLMNRPVNTGSGGDMWPACPMIRAYGRFNNLANATVGATLNLTFTRVNQFETTVNITTPFPIGALAADQANYIPFVFIQRNLTGSGELSAEITNLTKDGFTIKTSTGNPVLISVLIVGG